MTSLLTHVIFSEGGGVDMGMIWNIVAGVSLLWIVYRVFLVFRKPTEELEEILGIDIPPIPEVTLSSIASDSVLLFWKSPENYFSPLSLSVQVNGIDVPFSRTDATIKITGLHPGRRYGLRVVTTNSAGHPSYSPLIQVQTFPEGGHYGSKLLSSLDASGRRNTGSRRFSQPLPGTEKGNPQARLQDPHHAETESKLKRRLDILRRDEEEAKAQLKEDNDEADVQIQALTEQRDELKKQAEDKEKDSQELRKKVNELEKQCKAAQRKKSERERKVQQKRAERQKMRDDVFKFEKEAVEIGEDIESTESQELELNESHNTKMDEAQRLLDKAQADAAGLEEELRELGIKVKKLEDEREKLHQELTADEEQAELREREEAEATERKLAEQQTHYHALWNLTSAADNMAVDYLERLRWLSELKAKDPSKFYPIPGLDYPHGGFPYPRRPRPARAPLSLNRANHPTYNHSATQSPTLSHSLAFAPLNTGFSGFSPMSQQDLEAHLTAGAPMSPSADTLLPSNLLGEDDDRSGPLTSTRPRLRTGSIPQIYRSSIPEASETNQDPQSPASIESKSPSLMSSPQQSVTNVNRFYGLDQVDDETHSVGSTNSPFAAPLPATSDGNSSNRRISNLLWSFNRQRDKTNLDDLPALGSLKSSQSQSFPTNLDSPEAEPSERKGAGIWAPMSSPFHFLNRSGKNPAEATLGGDTVRPRRRGLLGSKTDPVDVLTQGSSRPSSTYSYDQGVPGSVIEGQYGWQTPESSRVRAGPWGQNSSRRPSIQHGSTSNLSLNSTPLDPPDAPADPSKSQPAPIGTERFRIRQRPITPKLNPNAPSFTTRLFNRGSGNELKKKSTEFSDKSVKSREGVVGVIGSSAASIDRERLRELDALAKGSPPISRLSQDGHSIATSASVGESYDGLEPTTSSSAAHSESAAGSAPKESLMQRITRKSSSSKFTVPWSKDRGSKAPSRKEPSTPGDLDEEDPDGDYIGRGLAPTVESVTSTPGEKQGRGSRSWGRVMGKGRKKSELNMSDAGERSSETGDGIEVDEE